MTLDASSPPPVFRARPTITDANALADGYHFAQVGGANLPSGFLAGVLEQITASDGTYRHRRQVLQERVYGGAFHRTWTREAYWNGSAWTWADWTGDGAPWSSLSYSGNWGSGSLYYRRSGNRVDLKGQLVRATATSSGAIATLPSGYRPLNEVLLVGVSCGMGGIAPGNLCPGVLSVGSDGTMFLAWPNAFPLTTWAAGDQIILRAHLYVSE